MIKQLPSLLLSCALLLPSLSVAASQWELKKDTSGIKVFTKKVPGSAINPFRGEMVVKARLSSFVALLDDDKACSQWIFNCVSAKTIEKKDEATSFRHVINKIQWPFKHRDVAFSSVVTQNKANKQIVISLAAASNRYPLQKDMVRVKQMKASWVFTPMKNGEVKVAYEVLADPEGNLPKWLVNEFSIDMPYQTLSRMKVMLQKPAYKNAKLSNIID